MVVVVGPLAAAKAELHPAKVAMAVQTIPGEAFVSEPNLKQLSNEARITAFLFVDHYARFAGSLKPMRFSVSLVG